MQFYKLAIVFLIIGIQGCSYFQNSPEIYIKNEFDGSDVAVLDFAKQGTAFESNIGRIAADKLTDALFQKTKYKVIDRSIINSALSEMDVKSSEFLSVDDIKRIGLKLKANYLILGRINQLSSNEFSSVDPDKEIYLNFRIISVLNSEIVGSVNFKSKISSNPLMTVDQMIDKIVQSMVKE